MINKNEIASIVAFMDEGITKGVYEKTHFLKFLKAFRNETTHTFIEEKLVSLSVLSNPTIRDVYSLAKEYKILEAVLKDKGIQPVYFAVAMASYVCQVTTMDTSFIQSAWNSYRMLGKEERAYNSCICELLRKLAVFYG